MDADAIQGNVLAGFNKPHMRFLMVRLPRRVDDATAWLGEMAPLVPSTAAVAKHNREWKPGDRMTWTGVGLTRSGLERLGVPDVELRLGDHHAFLVGPEARARDLGDVGENAPESWIFGSGANRVDAVVTVAADDERDLAAGVDEARRIAESHFAAIAHDQPGDRLEHNREHFGFVDGGGQPRVNGFDANPDVEPGEFVLDAGVPTWLRGASFQVLRLLAQDVRGWRLAAGAAEDRIGRRLDGAKLPSPPDSSHVRKTFPDARYRPERHRLIRRGIPYGPAFEVAPDDERGMVFNAFMASIDRQYEFVQRLWANRSDFPTAGTGWDPVIGGPDPEEQRYREATDHAGTAWPARYVRTRGAVYAVALSLPGLDELSGRARSTARY